MGSMMLHAGRFLILVSVIDLALGVGLRAQTQTQGQAQGQGQGQGNDRRRESRDAVLSMRSPEPSDLGKENLDRVAASAVQLRTVLIKDPGILVELKRWVANEATNSGQIVDDEMMSDQAIFDRLENDVPFRSLATRLVQRYGYLLPSINPDSEIAKEQDLLMKERVRRLAARQEQEDQDTLAAEDGEKNPNRQESKSEGTNCDPRIQPNCNH